ncbi:MAG: toll/interleukin-1 receptor domain-containing protein [Melioribacteraceae bacterium]|nr:toll/interleukin-1 receptor domain-containing protein [Melioribacteraceae bacterium]
MLYDLFICHASEDKDKFVRPLALELKNQNIEVWYDEFSLKLGDSIRRAIDKGLSQSRFGVVVLSKSFFAKKWSQYELDGLSEREMAGNDKVILPIWFNISHEEVLNYSPSLANKKAVLSNAGIEKIVSEIISVVHPSGSPLLIARDKLLEWGIKPPVITDKYWLKVVEASNRVPGYGAVVPEESSWDIWSFPLPPKDDNAENWGERLAWTSMQMKWVEIAETNHIGILSKPEDVLAFIMNSPGLFETCVDFPSLLAEYAPQLTIAGFGGELEPYIETEYQKNLKHHIKLNTNQSSSNKKITLCDDEWCLRHPEFGNHKPSSIADACFSGSMFGPRVSFYEHADHLLWLISDESSWLPKNIRNTLIDGMKEWGVWYWESNNCRDFELWDTCGELFHVMYKCSERNTKFKMTEKVESDILSRVKSSISLLKLPETEYELFERFLEMNIIDSFINNEKRRRKRKQ